MIKRRRPLSSRAQTIYRVARIAGYASRARNLALIANLPMDKLAKAFELIDELRANRWLTAGTLPLGGFKVLHALQRPDGLVDLMVVHKGSARDSAKLKEVTKRASAVTWVWRMGHGLAGSRPDLFHQLKSRLAGTWKPMARTKTKSVWECRAASNYSTGE